MITCGDSHAGKWGWWSNGVEERMLKDYGIQLLYAGQGGRLMYKMAHRDSSDYRGDKSVIATNQIPHNSGPTVNLNSLQAGDIVVVQIGEIDSRIHIPKVAYTQGRSIQDVAREVGSKYMERLREWAKFKPHLTIIVVSVKPPDPYDHEDLAKFPTKENWDEHTNWGRASYRAKGVKALNKSLKAGCRGRIIFADLYDEFADDNGFTDYEACGFTPEDGCHIKNPEPFMKWFSENYDSFE